MKKDIPYDNDSYARTYWADIYKAIQDRNNELIKELTRQLEGQKNLQ